MTKEDLMQAYYIEKELKSWQEELKFVTETNIINSKIEELKRLRQEILDYIMNIDDCQTRLIFKLRCLDLLTWNAVADKIGGMNNEYTVKKRFYRYLEKCG